VHLDHVRMLVGNGGVKTKGRSLDVLSVIKKSIVTMKAALLCLNHAVIIAMARVKGDPKYASYRLVYGLNKHVELLNASGVDLSNGGGIEVLQQFQEYLSDYKIVFDGLYSDRAIFSGNSLSAKKLYLLYDRDSGHCNVINNLKGVMAKKYICNGCDTRIQTNVILFAPCLLLRYPVLKMSKYCGTCNRYFLSEKCFQNLLVLKVKGKLVLQWRQVCRNCSFLVTRDSKYECFKKVCTFCNKKQASGHLCYLAPLKPSKLSNKHLYVFFDTECTRYLEKRDGSLEHAPNFMCSANVL